jgi:hypothetical protein
MFSEDPALTCPVKAIPVMAIGKIRKRGASGNNSFTVPAVYKTRFNDPPEGVKPWVDIIEPLFQCRKLFRRYKKVKIIISYYG